MGYSSSRHLLSLGKISCCKSTQHTQPVEPLTFKLLFIVGSRRGLGWMKSWVNVWFWYGHAHVKRWHWHHCQRCQCLNSIGLTRTSAGEAERFCLFFGVRGAGVWALGLALYLWTKSQPVFTFSFEAVEHVILPLFFLSFEDSCIPGLSSPNAFAFWSYIVQPS